MVPSEVIVRTKRIASTKLHVGNVNLFGTKRTLRVSRKATLTIPSKKRTAVTAKLTIKLSVSNRRKLLTNTKLTARLHLNSKLNKHVTVTKLITKLYTLKSFSSGTTPVTQTPIKRFLLDGVEDMAIDIPHVVKTINKRIVYETSGNVGTLIYTPGTWNKSASAGSTVGIKFWGLIWTLQLTCKVDSLIETEIDPPDPAASQADLALLAKQLGDNPNITLRMYLSNPNDLQNDSDLLWISIYNSRPVYQVDLMPYLTRSNLFGVENGKQLKMDIIDNGYGVLKNDDSISVTGAVFEESNYFIGITGTVEPIVTT